MIKVTNLPFFEKQMQEKVFGLLESKAGVLQRKGDQIFQSMYSGTFGKDPVATGETKANSKVTTESKRRPDPEFRIIFEILSDPTRAKTWSKGSVKDYAIFFIAPLQARNPNYKFGKRPVVTKARDTLGKELGINN